MGNRVIRIFRFQECFEGSWRTIAHDLNFHFVKIQVHLKKRHRLLFALMSGSKGHLQQYLEFDKVYKQDQLENAALKLVLLIYFVEF